MEVGFKSGVVVIIKVGFIEDLGFCKVIVKLVVKVIVWLLYGFFGFRCYRIVFYS